jgi:hypothetical protein
VCLGNGVHNRQAQAGTAAGARRRCETDERMREIALREAGSMITNPYRDGITDMFADQ